MAKYKLSNVAKEDLIKIHHYGIKKFGSMWITVGNLVFTQFLLSNNSVL